MWEIPRAAAELWAGDAEAFAACGTGDCYLCGVPAAAGNHIIFGSPVDPAMAIIAPLCGGCTSLPRAEQARRLERMMACMWPGCRLPEN